METLIIEWFTKFDTIQAFGLLGAIIQLIAYGLMQLAYMDANKVMFSLLNFIGSFIMSIIAIIEIQYGFLLLEGSWAILSFVGMVRAIRSK